MANHISTGADTGIAPTSQTDVLIVGAGPTGLALGNALALHGLQFQIVDALESPNQRSKAHGLTGNAMDALDILGLAEPMLEAMQRPIPTWFLDWGGKTTAIDFEKYRNGRFPYTVPIPQQRIERVLSDALADKGREIVRGCRVLGYKMDNDAVSTTVSWQGREWTIQSRWIVGCDGPTSVVRKTLGLEMTDRSRPHKLWAAECDIEWDRARDGWWSWNSRIGQVTAVFIDHTEKWHVLIDHDPGSDASFEHFREVFRDRTGETGRLSNPTWCEVASVAARHPDGYMRERALLAGDAAHVQLAFGQGIASGIQDVINLSWKLNLTARAEATEGLLSTYEIERMSYARNVVREQSRFKRIISPRTRLGQRLQPTMIRAGERYSVIGSARRRQLGYPKSLNYESSPLSVQQSATRVERAKAGWFMPSATCRIGGRAADIREILPGTSAKVLVFHGARRIGASPVGTSELTALLSALEPHIETLQVFGSEADARRDGMDESSQSVVIDGVRRVREAFGVTGPELLYIRPDGYIGLRTQVVEPAVVRGYLENIYADSVLKTGPSDGGVVRQITAAAFPQRISRISRRT